MQASPSDECMGRIPRRNPGNSASGVEAQGVRRCERVVLIADCVQVLSPSPVKKPKPDAEMKIVQAQGADPPQDANPAGQEGEETLSILSV